MKKEQPSHVRKAVCVEAKPENNLQYRLSQ